MKLNRNECFAPIVQKLNYGNARGVAGCPRMGGSGVGLGLAAKGGLPPTQKNAYA